MLQNRKKKTKRKPLTKNNNHETAFVYKGGFLFYTDIHKSYVLTDRIQGKDDIMSANYPPPPFHNTEQKNTSKRSILIIVIIVLTLLIGICSGILIANNFSKDNTKSAPTAEKTTPTDDVSENVSPKVPWKYTVLVFEPSVNNPTKEQMETVLQIMRTRLDGLGLVDAIVTIENGTQIKVQIPSDRVSENHPEILAATAQLQFTDSEGNVLLNGADIRTAKAEYGQFVEQGPEQYYIEIEFTEEGTKKFSQATASNIGKPIYILMDAQIISAPTVNEQINSNICTISGDFTEDSAKSLAANIRAGQLPFSLNLCSSTITTEY